MTKPLAIDDHGLPPGCPNCGSGSPEHLAMKIGTRKLSNGRLERFQECNVCMNCKHEWPFEKFDFLKRSQS
jgi:ssDNA-binding Zn-finger/Zn-ribbon topoisomerase 1